MEVEWIADRATLRSLAHEHPEWTQQDFADALGRSLSWVKKWLKRLREAPPDDLQVLLSQSRAHHTPYPQVHPRIIQRIVEIREHPPENLQRTPGPRAILYYLHRDQEGPRATSLSSAFHSHPLARLAEVRMYPGCTSSFSPPTRASRSYGRDSTRFQGCDQRVA